MDEAVRQALARWPDVPDCFGWLSLSRRGEWQLPDGPIRHAGLRPSSAATTRPTPTAAGISRTARSRSS
jgi:hypothetical protein